MLRIKKGIVFLLVFLLAVTGMQISGHAAEQTLFVAPGGSDAAAGTINAPLATLSGAKERAKAMTGPVTVYFRAGSYTFHETVDFRPGDKEDVVYRAYGDEEVVFTAGEPITGFRESRVNGVRAFRKQVGIAADFNVLFNGETTLPRPRYPETGYLLVRGAKEADIVNPEQTEAVHHAFRAMYVNGKDVPKLTNEKDVLIRILHYWKDEMVTVKKYDPASGRMEFSRPTSMQVQENDRYFFENVFAALNAPGEWYLDRAAGTLWYVPFEGETAENLTLWASDLDTMITVDGVNGISFENITFRGNGFRIPRGNAERDLSSQAAYDATPCVSFERCENAGLKNCEFRDIAACAVYFGSGVKNAAVANCYFGNLGAQAVFIRGENVTVDDPRVTKDVRIVNNIVNGYGKEFFNAVGILAIHVNHVEIENNEIRDGYYTAISCGWVWGYAYNVTYNNSIRNNLIYDIGQGWLSDMGGIYMLGVQPGTVLSGNVIHNVAADPGQGGYGGWGIYLDEGSSKITVEKNLVYACGSDAYHLHYGADNLIRNNIFALSAESQVRVNSRFEDHKTADFTDNILLTNGKAAVFSHMQKPAALTAENNLFWDVSNGAQVFFLDGGDENSAMSLQTAKRKGLLGGNKVADPLFADPLGFDFTLSPDSPALRMGFEPWDYAAAGTQPGAVIGAGRPGGQTAYNGRAAHVTPRACKERLPLLNRLLNTLYTFLVQVFPWIKNVNC